MRRDIELVERLNDRTRDRVVTATGAQRRHGAFVIAMRVAELVAWKLGVMQPGFDEIGHGSSVILRAQPEESPTSSAWTRIRSRSFAEPALSVAEGLRMAP